MALINLQTQKPSLRKSIVSSSVFRPSAPIASVAKIPFGGVAKSAGFGPKPLEIGNIDQPSESSPLYDVVEALRADVHSLRQEQNEAAEIIGDIGNALATDFANRITEEKAHNTKLNKERIRLKRKEKEENLEKKTVSNILGKKTGKGLKGNFGGGIFGKLMQFFTTIGAGMALTNAFRWLKNKENREALSNLFKGIVEHWKWIVGGIGAVIAIDIGLKLAGLASILTILGPVLTSPLFWAGIGIAMAAAHQGLGKEEKEILRDLNLMPGGPSEENREMLAQKYEKIIKETMPLGSKGALFGERGELEQKIKFLRTGKFGGHGSEKSLNWEMLNTTGNVKIEKPEKRHAGGSITKGRTYALEPGEIPFKAPFTGTVATAGKVRQLLASRGGRTTIINMPPEVIEGKMPEIKGDSPIATHVNLIDSMNALNPYMTETPSVLGISV